MSPVVGVTLLVGIVVLLAGITAAVFLDLGREREPSPDVVFETERPAHGPGMVLVHGGGTVLDGANVELRGVARPDGLSGRFGSGDGHHVFPTDERVQVVWHGERTSYVIWEASVPPGDRVPGPGEDCSFVEAETGGGSGDFAVSDVRVGCAVETAGQVDTDNVTVLGGVESTGADVDAQNSAYYGDLVGVGQVSAQDTVVSGRVDADSQVDLDLVTVGGRVVGTGQVDVQDGTVGGPVESRSQDVALQNVTADGGVTADTSVDLDASELGGAVVGGGQVDVDGGSVGGPVTSSGQDIQVSTATVDGAVDAATQVDADGAQIAGGVDAGGQVDVDGGSVGGPIDAGGDTSVASATVDGAVESPGDVDLDAATVEGDVYGAGQVDLDDVTVTGEVYAGSFQCDNATVGGQDCGDYTPESPGDY